MDKKDINELISLFNQQADYIKNCLTDLFVIVSDGRIPSRDDINVLVTEMDVLNNRYDEIYQYAKENVIEEELPPMGSNVAHYANAIKNSRINLLKQQIATAKEILIKFISIKSMLIEYAESLKPYQDEALKLLDQISEATIGNIITQIEAPRAFLSAVECDDINSTDGIKLLEQVSRHYSTRVQWGLVGKQYYFDQTQKELKTVEMPPELGTNAKNLGIVEALMTIEPNIGDAPEDIGTESITDRTAKNGLDNSEKVNETVILSQETSGVIVDGDSLSEKEAVMEYTDLESSMLKVANKTKNGTPNASSFRKEVVKLSKINEKVCVVLPMLTNFGILTKEQIYLFGVCMDCFDESDKSKNAIDKAVEALISKGYLSCFEVNLNGEQTAAYCLAAYSNGCLHKESVSLRMKGFWGLPFGKYEFVYDIEAKKTLIEAALNANVLLLRYVYAMKSILSKDDYQKVKQSIRWKQDHYQVTVVYNGELFNSYLVDQYIFTDKVEAVCLLFCEYVDVQSLRFNERNERIFMLQQGALDQYILENGSLRLEIVNDEKDEEVLYGENEKEDKEPVFENKGLLESGGATKVKSNFVSECKQTTDITHIEKTLQNFEEDDILNVTPESLLEKKGVPSDDEFYTVIEKGLNRSVTTKEQLTSAIVQSVLLAKGAGLERNRPKTKKLSAQLRLATSLLSGEAAYTSENLAAAFTNPEEENKPMMFAAYLFAMLAPSMAFDYGLRNQTLLFLEDYEKYFAGLSVFKPLFNKMMSVRDVSSVGFSPATIALLGSDAESQTFLAELRATAQACLTVQAPKARIKALPILYNTCFGIGSDFYECMRLIATDKRESDSLEFVETILSEYCDRKNDVFMISMSKIEDRLNEEWDKIIVKNKFKLEYDARDQAVRQFVIRVEVMLPWVEHINNSNEKKDSTRLRSLKGEILDLIMDIQKKNAWKKIDYANVLAWMLQYMEMYLKGQGSKLKVYSELLLTGIISLNDDGTPKIDATMTEIRFYEPWRNALRHIVAKRCSAEEVKSEILGDNLDIDDESGLKDNLHQLELLGKHLGSTDEAYVITEGQREEATEFADECTKRFMETLELAYTYNRINEMEKETLANIMAKYKPDFYAVQDFACWRRFLKALEEQIQEFAESRKQWLRVELDSRLKQNTVSSLLREADRLLEEDMNFSVTEEYINRFDTGETELDNELDFVLRDYDYFSDFLSEEKFDRLFQECKRNNGRVLKTFGWNFLEKHLPKEWTSRQRDDSQKMITNWPTRNYNATPTQIQNIFTCLGFNVLQTFNVNGRKEVMFQVVVTPSERSKADYLHPIAAFGTQLKTPINVILLYGNRTEKQLVDTITSLNLGGISVVLVDRPIDLAGRRLIGEIFHTQTSGQNPFLLVDQVLFLYLAMHQVTERLPALLKCTLPYTTYQPFVRDGGSTADEMFCGRTQELATIIDPNGACVVYGGRQLGKTALLERAESRCSKPEIKAYAIYTSIIRIDSEAEVVATLISDIEKKTDGNIRLQGCDTLKKLCEQLSRMFRSKRIVSMHLFIDEVDDFLAAIADESYRPIQPLVDLKRETKNNFKFVIAGLHNVCRAKNATEQNGIFGQLGMPLCIKPLSPTDALKLLSRPLSYLGFQIDRYPHLETILTNTNYYPGILQFFGYMLVETLTGQYSKYYSATKGNPPFTLQDEQLGAVMNSSDLNKSIKDKFRWSLELDSRYFMLARCITMLYHFFEEDRTSGSWLGFKVDEIIDMADTYGIHCLEKETRNGFINLLDEMVEMGILSSPADGLYRLRRGSFVDIIGENIDALEADICNNNEGV